MSDGSGQDRAVGLAGIGLLGSAIAERLILSGLRVRGYDPAASAMEQFTKFGGLPVRDVRELTGCERIVLCLPDSETVGQVLDDMRPLLRSATVIIDTTTGDPRETRRQARRLSGAGVALIDAAVLGSSSLTRQGKAVLIAGADTDALEKCRPVLRTIAESIYHVGPVGAGQETKLVANLVLGLNRAALAEGLHLARLLDLDLSLTLDVLRFGASYSRIMDTKGKRMINSDFAPEARLSQHLKDVRLILERARNYETKLPLSETHRMLLERVQAAGDGGLDNSAIIRAWESG